MFNYSNINDDKKYAGGGLILRAIINNIHKI
jgi:hypothetical protein